MKTREIRERLTEQRAMYRASLENSNKAVSRIKEIIAGMDNDCIKDLAGDGIDASFIYDFDYERMQKEEDYWRGEQDRLARVIGQLHKFLEEGLNV